MKVPASSGGTGAGGKDIDDDSDEEGDDNIFATGKYVVRNEEEDVADLDNVVKSRRYDLSITYDFYY